MPGGMDQLTSHPLLFFAVTLAATTLASATGLFLRARAPLAGAGQRDDFDKIAGATLTLLALIIGFSFSLAASRYDQRKNLEEEEANAIGTEFLRADVLPAADAANVRRLLVAYLDQRILFFTNDDKDHLGRINKRTDQLQDQLWTAVRGPVDAEPTAATALALSGMNDVINARGYSQAAKVNRIPAAAWYLMAAIALGGNVLLGYGTENPKGWSKLAYVLPLVISLSFLLIADMDSPEQGLIRVNPVNLQSLAASLKG
jgi:hypothetical protein